MTFRFLKDGLVVKIWSKVYRGAGKLLKTKMLCFFVACLYGSTLLVFGGTGVPFGETASNDIHRCNLKTLEWSSMQCEGPAPIRSYGHVSVLIIVIISCFARNNSHQCSMGLCFRCQLESGWRLLFHDDFLLIPYTYMYTVVYETS